MEATVEGKKGKNEYRWRNFGTGEGKLAEEGQRKAGDVKKEVMEDQQGHK